MNIKSNKLTQKGFSLIELIIVVVIIGIIAAIAVPNLLQARIASNEASAVSSISLIYRSELTYSIAEGGEEYTDLTGLFNGHYIDETLGSGLNIKSGYRFETDVFPSTSSVAARINIRARPVIHSQTNFITGTGGKDFGINESGGMYQTEDNTPVTFDDTTRLPLGTAVPTDGN